MTHLLHLDSSIQGDASVSRALTARAADRWRAAHPDGTVTYRDLATNPIPHLVDPASSQTSALSAVLIDEVKRADTIVLGLPLYNFGPPSAVKAWVDHVIVPGVSFDPETHAGLIGDADLIVIATRGGGYGQGTPREGWDHSEAWLPHGLALTGLTPRIVTVELTMADANPAMADLRDLAAQNRARAEATIDGLWARQTAA